MFVYLTQGLLLGGAASAQPGPLQAYLLGLTLKSGWRRAIWATFAPLLSDGPIVALMLLLLTQMPDWFLSVLRLAGGCFLIYLAWDAYRSLSKVEALTEASVPSSQQGIWKAALMNALSPNPYIFWATIAGPIVIEAWQIAPLLGVSFVVGFYSTLVGGFMAFVFLFAVVGQVSEQLNRGLTIFSAVALLLFGIYQIVLGVSAL